MALVCRQWRALATASVKVGALGHRDVKRNKTCFLHRLTFYAKHCGSLVSVDLSYWPTRELEGIVQPAEEYLRSAGSSLQSLSLRCSGDSLVRGLLPWLPISLRSLDLTDTKFYVRDMEHISRLTNLTTLNVSGTQITDDELTSIVSALPLRKLDLWHSRVRGSCFVRLPPTLKSINVGDVSEARWLLDLPSDVRSIKGLVFTDDHLRGLPPRLRSLSAFYLQLSSPNSLALLPSTLTRLSVPQIAAGDFALLPPSLLRLEVSQCILDPLVRMPPHLELLQIALAAMTEEQMGSLCAALPRLSALTLDWYGGADSEGWHHLSLLTSLRTLRLRSTTADGSFLAFLPPTLLRLDLTPPALDVSWLRFLPARVLCQYVGRDGERTTVAQQCSGAIIKEETIPDAEEQPQREKRRRKETTLEAAVEGER